MSWLLQNQVHGFWLHYAGCSVLQEVAVCHMLFCCCEVENAPALNLAASQQSPMHIVITPYDIACIARPCTQLTCAVSEDKGCRLTMEDVSVCMLDTRQDKAHPVRYASMCLCLSVFNRQTQSQVGLRTASVKQAHVFYVPFGWLTDDVCTAAVVCMVSTMHLL